MNRNILISLLLVFAVLLSSCSLYTAATVTNRPTAEPTTEPTVNPTAEPTVEPTTDQTTDPTADRTLEPIEIIYADVKVPEIRITYDESSALSTAEYTDAEIAVAFPDGMSSSIFDANGGIRIRGNSTSAGMKKPYNIKFSTSINLLGLGKAKKWYLLANMYDKSLIRNKLALDFAREIGLSNSSNAEYVDLYINGEYTGNYLLCESVGVGKTRVDINQDANEFLLEKEPYAYYKNQIFVVTDRYYLLFGLDDTDTASEEQLEYLKKFLNDFEAALLTGKFEEYSKFIDVDSFINYYIVNELFKNVDFSLSSTRFYIKDGIMYAGPAWDFDLSSGNCSMGYYPAYHNPGTSGNSYEGLWCDGFWYKTMLADNTFYSLLKDRYRELQPTIENLTDDSELGKSKIDIIKTKYHTTLNKNSEVWIVGAASSILEYEYPKYTVDGNIEFLREWLRARNAWLKSVYVLS